MGKDDFEKQAEQVFLNLKNTVESAGGTMDNVVKLGIYVIDMSPDAERSEGYSRLNGDSITSYSPGLLRIIHKNHILNKHLIR